MKVVWLPRAIADRDAQLAFVAVDSLRAAIDGGDRIEQHVDRLETHPEMSRTGRQAGTRELVIPRTPFILVYRVRSRMKRIEILRLLHGAQQWPKG